MRGWKVLRMVVGGAGLLALSVSAACGSPSAPTAGTPPTATLAPAATATDVPTAATIVLPTADARPAIATAVAATLTAVPTPTPPPTATATRAPASPTPSPTATPAPSATATPAPLTLAEIQQIPDQNAREQQLARYVIEHPIQYNFAPKSTPYHVAYNPALCRTEACMFVGHITGATKLTNTRSTFGVDTDVTVYHVSFGDMGGLGIVDYYTFGPAKRFDPGKLMRVYGYVSRTSIGRTNNNCTDADCSVPLYRAAVFGDAIDQ